MTSKIIALGRVYLLSYKVYFLFHVYTVGRKVPYTEDIKNVFCTYVHRSAYLLVFIESHIGYLVVRYRRYAFVFLGRHISYKFLSESNNYVVRHTNLGIVILDLRE